MKRTSRDKKRDLSYGTEMKERKRPLRNRNHCKTLESQKRNRNQHKLPSQTHSPNHSPIEERSKSVDREAQ